MLYLKHNLSSGRNSRLGSYSILLLSELAQTLLNRISSDIE